MRDSDLDELKDDGEGRGDVEGQPAAFEVCQRAEDGRSEDESDVAKSEKVGGSSLKIANPIVVSHGSVVKLTKKLF